MALKLIQGKQINVNLTGSFTGSFTGNLIGSASFATTSSFSNTAVSSSFASTASFAQSGNGSFSGSFSGSGANLSGIPASGIVGLNLSQIATGSVTASVSPTQFTVTSGSSTELVVTGTGVTLGNIITDTHRVTGSLSISGSVTATNFTGSLFGTASWANNATSASFAVSSSRSVSSSFSISASFAQTSSIVQSIANNITNNVDNYVLTATGGNNINGESNLTFDGSLLKIQGSLEQGAPDVDATGTGTHAEGRRTTAKGEYSHAEGSDTTSTGDYSHAEGSITETSISSAFSTKKSNGIVNGLVTLDSSYGDQTSHFTPGKYLYLYDSALNIPWTSYLINTVSYNGTNTLIQLVDTNINADIALVGDLTNLLDAGTFRGDETIPGPYAHSEGYRAKAVGQYSHAEGDLTHALGVNSHAEGYSTQAVGVGSHAEGATNQAVGQYSHAEGEDTVAIGYASHTEGQLTQAGIQTAYTTRLDTGVSSGLIVLNGSYGDVTGNFTPGGYLYLYDEPFQNNYNRAVYLIDTVTWDGSNTQIQLVDTAITTNIAYVGDLTYLRDNQTFGGDRTIPGPYAHSEGYNTQAIGTYAHAEGNNSQAIGQSSHAEGDGSQAIGQGSHAEGRYSQAIGNQSHAEGFDTIALGDYSHVQGQFNQASTVPSAFIIGNGTNDNNRSNLIFAAGNTVQVTGSVIATQGFTGSLLGTAATASFAPAYLPISGGTISGSLVIQNNLTVLGSASIQHISESTLNIGTNLITVNTFNPGARFGGLAVIDSGSSPQVSASFLYDSVQDEFIFVHRGTSTSAITSSHFVLGPETYNNLGNETYLTANRIPKGVGNEHLNDSNISDNGSVVSINSNTQVTGSLTVTQGITGSLFGTSSFAVSASWAPSQAVDTSSLVTTSSFNAFTSSYNTGSFTGSFTGSLLGTSSWSENAVTASYVLNAVSSSFASTASFAPNYVLNSATSSFIQNSQTSSMTVLSASFANVTGSLGYTPAPNFIVTDRSLTSTIVGLSSFTTRRITEIDCGPYVIVDFDIDGTGNATTFTFTLSFTASVRNRGFIARRNNNATFVQGTVSSTAGSNVITLFQDMNSSVWTAAGNRTAIGQLIVFK